MVSSSLAAARPVALAYPPSMSDWLLPVSGASEHDRLGRKWLARAAGLRTARALGESDRMSVFAATVAAVAVAAVAVAAPPLLPSCCRRRRCRHAAPMSTAPPLGHAAVRDLGSGGGRAFFARGWSLFCWELRWGSVGCSGTVRKHVNPQTVEYFHAKWLASTTRALSTHGLHNHRMWRCGGSAARARAMGAWT